ncbi:hypothetical protein [Paraburkholderia mimosarum]|uniref:hypothetical protein n=1 Tax=Paraburkholderia mimosarum TaxID=312026 RepID=UPI00048536AA|nr:hypothetical protein [Paraburkholderia mimosarum]
MNCKPKIIHWEDVEPTRTFLKYSIAASDLGLGLDEWPLFLETAMGSGRPFERMQRLEHGTLYRQGRDLVLLVFNSNIINRKVWSSPCREKALSMVVS